MQGPYPGAIRMRVIDFVEAGESRREAAEQFDVSVSSAIRWVQSFHSEGRSEPMRRGGSISPLEKYSQRILALIGEQPDLTLNEMVCALRKRRIQASRSALSRFFARHDITVKKSLQAAKREPADVARARRRWIREQGLLVPGRLVFFDETAVTTNMVRPNGWSPRGVRLVGHVPMSHWETRTFPPTRSLQLGCVRRRSTRASGEKARTRDYRRDLPGCGFTLGRATNPRSQQRYGC
jgi:transposase